MWFSTISICGYRIPSLANVDSGPSFRIYALISEVPEYIDVTKIKSLMHFYIGFDIKSRNVVHIKCLANELEDYVKSLNIPTIGAMDFYAGINAEAITLSYPNEEDTILELI